MSLRRIYAQFCASMGYSPGNPNAIDRGASVWFVSQNGNYCRFDDARELGVTVCLSKHGDIGIVYNVNGESGWHGPFDTAEEAMEEADRLFFG
jgi:streptogramin lyase